MNLIKAEQSGAEGYKLVTEEIEFKEKTINIVKLTQENVYKVEAMIATDSDYKETELGNSGISYKKDGKTIKYIGSSKYWFKQLEEIIFSNKGTSSSGKSYAEILEYLIISIDNENSTHLNSDKVGRELVKKRLTELSKDKLIELLKNDNKKYELINLIQTPKEKNEKNHFSFATKFCHYACINLFNNEEYEEYVDSYSIYDSVLKNALPYYIQRYLKKEVDVKEYDKDHNYKKYIEYIDEIRDAAEKENGAKISRNGFDHLIWYYHKGKKI